MKIIIGITLLVAICASCMQGLENSKMDKPSIVLKKDTVIDNKNFPLSGCFQMAIDTDSAFMNLTHEKDSIKGPLSYHKNGKVTEDGFVYLAKVNNRAEGWFIYKLAGKIFTIQKIFKIEVNKLAEGYGDIKMEKDTAFFKYPHALNFEEKHSFNKVSCK